MLAPALASLVALPGCLERDPCFYPESYDECAPLQPLAGCPDYGAIPLGPAPNVPAAYLPPGPTASEVEPVDLEADFTEEYAEWTRRIDPVSGGGSLVYYAPDRGLAPLRYAFDLSCADLEGYDGHVVYAWIRARVDVPGMGLNVESHWGAHTSRLVSFADPGNDADYLWVRYNDAFGDNQHHGRYDPERDGRQLAVFITACNSDEVCPGGSASVERIIITGDPSYRPPEAE